MVKKNADGSTRVVPYGGGQQIVTRLRKELWGALNIQKGRNRPLDMLLADQIDRDAAGTLNKLAKFLPQEVSVGATSDFALALGEVAQRIQASTTGIIDITPDNSKEELGDNAQDAEIIDEPKKPLEQKPLKVPNFAKLRPDYEPPEKPKPKPIQLEPEPEPEPEPVKADRKPRRQSAGRLIQQKKKQNLKNQE